MYDLVIIGGGPAGAAGGVYAARKQIKTLLITEEFGGQSIVSDDIQNWIGTPHISGMELAKNLKAHVLEYAGDWVSVHEYERVEDISKAGDGWSIKTNKDSYQTKTVLITTGSSRRRLDVPGALKFEHKGVTYCASCDGPMFSGMDVVVVGGGNAGFESAAQLLAYAKSVTLLHRRDEYKADKITVDKVLSHPHMAGIRNVEPVEVLGENMVTGLKYKDKVTGEIHEIPCQGIFVEIGAIPNTAYAKDVLELIPETNCIKIDPWTQRASADGIWAAGDCTNILYHQNNIAAGDAVRAVEDLYLWLNA